MKKTTLTILLCLLTMSHLVVAQFAQLELATGLAKTDFTSFSLQPLNDKGTFSIATLAFFQKYHKQENNPFDELGVQPTAFWNFSKAIAIGPSLYYNSVAGFSERISLLLTTKSVRFSFTAIPSLAHLSSTGALNGELFIQTQYTVPLKEHWNALVSALILTHWDQFSTHARSFQQVRAGLSYHTTQFGVAVDFDQYGPRPITQTSVGLFVRKIFISKQ